MGFRFFGTPTSPIAIDFGTSSVKLLQTGLGERPTLLAAAELPKPFHDEEPSDVEDFDFLANELPRLIRSGGFKGRRVVFTVPSRHTIIQHLQLGATEGIKREDAVKSQLQMQMNISPHNTVVRWIDVTEIHRDGQAKTELICFAIPRDVVMRYVSLLEKMRLQVVDVQTEIQSIVRAFDHIHRRAGDENMTTMYIDLGWSNSKVAIAHGRSITFARSIQVGGMHLDRMIAKQRSCDLICARGYRLSMPSPVASPAKTPDSPDRAHSPAPGNTPAESNNDGDAGGGFARLAAAMARERHAETSDDAPRAAMKSTAPSSESIAERERRDRREGRFPTVLPEVVEATDARATSSAVKDDTVDLSEALDTITDELSMCLRYHRGLFPDRSIDRVILLGGEARQPWLCRHIVRSLRVPARLGDPLARFLRDDQTIESIGLSENQAQPGWAVISGLCSSATS